MAYGSVVLSEDYDGPQQVQSYALEDHQPRAYSGVPHAVYLIAVASDGILPTLGVGLFDLPLARAPVVKASLEHATRLQSAIDELHSTIESVAMERDAYRRAVSDLEDALHSKSVAHNTAQARLSEFGSLQAAVDELRGTIDALLVERDAYRQAVENLQDALRSQSAEHARDMDGSREVHARDIDGVLQQLQVAQQEVDELRATLDSVAVEGEAYKRAVSDLEDALRAISSAHDAALARVRELGGLQAAVDELRGTVEALLIERDAYRQAVENLQDALRSQSAEHARDMDGLREVHARDIDGVLQQLQVAQQDNARGQILICEHMSRIRELESREAQLILKQREVEAARDALMLELSLIHI